MQAVIRGTKQGNPCAYSPPITGNHQFSRYTGCPACRLLRPCLSVPTTPWRQARQCSAYRDSRGSRSRPFKLTDIARGFPNCSISFGSLHCEADTFRLATSICQRKQSLKITGMTWIGRYFVSIYSSQPNILPPLA
jgi:hypothetical protein